MMHDVAAFPPDGGAVDDSVDCEVRLAALDPRRGVVSGAERHRCHEQAVKRGFGGFALAAIQHLRDCQEAIASSQPAICHPRVAHVFLPRSDVRRPKVIRCKSCATVRALGRVSGPIRSSGDSTTGKMCELETEDWLEGGSPELETGNWELETGNWKLETRSLNPLTCNSYRS